MRKLLTLREAQALAWQAVVDAPPSENVALEQAHGRRLATDVRADVPWPTTDRSAMDGFALRVGDAGAPAGTVLRVAGESLAGHPFAGVLAAGKAIRIMTGAVVPPGADTVVPVELTSGFGADTVTLQEDVHAGSNIRRAGSEVRVGDLLLAAGTRIRAAEIGALAVLGIDPVPVSCRPRVAILATGDEVVDVGRVPAPHQVRDSNSHCLAALVREAGGSPLRLGIVPDVHAALRDALQRALESDLVLTIGGVSQGTHDLVHAVLGELGVEQVFHGIQLKPGMPTFFGRRRTTPVFGLPGNPASCFVVFDLLVRPLLEQLAGASPRPPSAARAVLAGVPFPVNRRLQAIPARLRVGEDGRLVATLGKPRPSGDPFGMLEGNGYVLVPPEATPVSVREAEVWGYAPGLCL
jgi:molybdopterin molybdotransferase